MIDPPHGVEPLIDSIDFLGLREAVCRYTDYNDRTHSAESDYDEGLSKFVKKRGKTVLAGFGASDYSVGPGNDLQIHHIIFGKGLLFKQFE